MSAKRHKVTSQIAVFVFAVFSMGCGSQPQEQPVAASKGKASDEPLANPYFAPPKLEFQKTAQSIAPQPAFTLPKEAQAAVETWITALEEKNSDALVSMMLPPWLESNGAILQSGDQLANAARILMDECRGARLTVKESYPFSDPRAHELNQRLKIIAEQNPKAQIAPPKVDVIVLVKMTAPFPNGGGIRKRTLTLYLRHVNDTWAMVGNNLETFWGIESVK